VYSVLAVYKALRVKDKPYVWYEDTRDDGADKATGDVSDPAVPLKVQVRALSCLLVNRCLSATCVVLFSVSRVCCVGPGNLFGLRVFASFHPHLRVLSFTRSCLCSRIG
jgi:hypothetical protein